MPRIRGAIRPSALLVPGVGSSQDGVFLVAARGPSGGFDVTPPCDNMDMGKAPGRHYRKGITLVELFSLFPDEQAAEAWFVA